MNFKEAMRHFITLKPIGTTLEGKSKIYERWSDFDHMIIQELDADWHTYTWKECGTFEKAISKLVEGYSIRLVDEECGFIIRTVRNLSEIYKIDYEDVEIGTWEYLSRD